MAIDWLWAIPTVNMYDSEPILVQQLAEDPEAAAIPDEEAERFVAVGYTLRNLTPNMSLMVYRSLGMRISRLTSVSYRRACLTAMRNWHRPKTRELLIHLAVNCSFSGGPKIENGEYWTEERFRAAYQSKTNLLWLVVNRRHLGMEVDGWLERLGAGAQHNYQMWLMLGKITMRNLVQVQPKEQEARAEPVETPTDKEQLTRKLRQKAERSGALRSGVRQLERTRKQLKEQARRQELEARQMLSQARGEVAAARSQLQERLGAQRRELAAREAEQTRRLAAVAAQVAAARAAFRDQVARLAERPELPVLAGVSVAVAREAELDRLLIRALGGTPVDPDTAGSPAGAAGAAGQAGAFDRLPDRVRSLRRLAAQRLVISCDGLYRRRAGRPGIAIGGFLVRWGRRVVYEEGRVVSCGGMAGSLQAEYGALVLALCWLAAGDLTGVQSVEVQSDCKAMLRQLHVGPGMRIRRGTVQLRQRVQALLMRLRGQGLAVTLRWVPREQVENADRLCDRVYRRQSWYRRSGSDSYRQPLRLFLGPLRRRHLAGAPPAGAPGSGAGAAAVSAALSRALSQAAAGRQSG